MVREIWAGGGFHGVLVGGLEVEQMSRLQRAYIAGDDFLGDQIRLPLSADVRDHSCSEENGDDHSRGNRQPLGDRASPHRNDFWLNLGAGKLSPNASSDAFGRARI